MLFVTNFLFIPMHYTIKTINKEWFNDSIITLKVKLNFFTSIIDACERLFGKYRQDKLKITIM